MITLNPNDAYASMQPKKLPSFYRERLAPSIVQTFDAILEASRDQQLEILEEIALLRETTAQTVEVWSEAREMHRIKPSERTAAMVMQTALIMREAIAEVIKAVEVAKKMDNASKNKLNMTSFSYFIGQMMKIVNNSGASIEVVESINSGLEQLITDFDDEVNNQHKSKPIDDIRRIVLTPDATVIEMDQSIPLN